jgi:hypothetical protein
MREPNAREKRIIKSHYLDPKNYVVEFGNNALYLKDKLTGEEKILCLPLKLVKG